MCQPNVTISMVYMANEVRHRTPISKTPKNPLDWRLIQSWVHQRPTEDTEITVNLSKATSALCPPCHSHECLFPKPDLGHRRCRARSGSFEGPREGWLPAPRQISAILDSVSRPRRPPIEYCNHAMIKLNASARGSHLNSFCLLSVMQHFSSTVWETGTSGSTTCVSFRIRWQTGRQVAAGSTVNVYRHSFITYWRPEHQMSYQAPGFSTSRDSLRIYCTYPR